MFELRLYLMQLTKNYGSKAAKDLSQIKNEYFRNNLLLSLILKIYKSFDDCLVVRGLYVLQKYWSDSYFNS